MKFSLTDPYYSEKLKVLDVLHKVIDPELFINVVDLGLIYNIDFCDSKHVKVTMTLSTPHCPMGEAITNSVKHAVELLFDKVVAEIDLTFSPPWSFEMLSDEGKTQLGLK